MGRPNRRLRAMGRRYRRPMDEPDYEALLRPLVEGRRVILAGVSGTAFSISGPGGAMSEDDPRDAAARQRMLLYVAATRARDELVVTSSGTASELLPKNGSC